MKIKARYRIAQDCAALLRLSFVVRPFFQINILIVTEINMRCNHNRLFGLLAGSEVCSVQTLCLMTAQMTFHWSCASYMATHRSCLLATLNGMRNMKWWMQGRSFPLFIGVSDIMEAIPLHLVCLSSGGHAGIRGHKRWQGQFLWPSLQRYSEPSARCRYAGLPHRPTGHDNLCFGRTHFIL